MSVRDDYKINNSEKWKDLSIKDVENKKYFQDILDQVQQEAFMEGYCYAIQVLKENIVNKEKTK